MNTWFKLPKRRLYTWQSPGHTNEKIVRNQIDYICINKRYRNSITCTKTYPGADINSDHIPLTCKVRLKLKKLKKGKARRSFNTPQLHDKGIQKQFSIRTDEVDMMDRIDTEEKLWSNIKNTLLDAAEQTLGYREIRKNKSWVTEEILKLFEERSKSKQHPDKYKQINEDLQCKIREAKENDIMRQCHLIEHLEATHQYGELHKTLKKMSCAITPCSPSTIMDSDGKLLLALDQKLQRWEEYIGQLFHDNRPDQSDYGHQLTGPPILLEELNYALMNAKTGRAAGEDAIPVELLKHSGINMRIKLVNLFNKIYNTGNIPKDLLRSTFVTIPKKPKAVKCEEYRTISLMSHTMKMFLTIIYNRIKGKCLEGLCSQQFGFRPGVGTREAIFTLNTIVERTIAQQRNVYLCFIDYEKAFDRVQHAKLMEILERKGLDDKDRRLIGNLYWNQEAAVKIEGKLSKWKQIQRGVRQGCVLSPVLFNVYSEAILTNLLQTHDEGISVNGMKINNIRYADDTVLIADTEHGLQKLLEDVADAGDAMGLNINVKKTKSMVISKIQMPLPHITLGGAKITAVKKFKYLGRTFTSDLDQLEEIKCRIGQAKSAFNKMNKVLCDPKIPFATRLRVLKCYVWSTLLYGCETWVLKKESCRRLQAFEMWGLRKMFKISWKQYISNVRVLQRAKCKRMLMTAIVRRKVAFFGHLQRGSLYEFPRLILEGKIAGKRAPGRPRREWFDDIREWTRHEYYSLKEISKNRKLFHQLTAELQFEDGTI